MGRAEERRARQRGGHRAAPKRRRSEPTVDATRAAATPTTAASTAADGATVVGGRSAKPAKPPKGRIRRLFTWKKILGTFFGFCLLGIGGFVGLYLYVDIPAGNALAKQESNVYKYSDGTLLARVGETNRESVDLSKVPKDVQHTFVAAENKTFYTDSGIDLKGLARGLFNTVTGRGKQGGSTITQQYVKNYYLNQDQTATRKLKEMVISLKVDRKKTKNDILAGYINTSYYGRSAYGIQAAAQAYYGVDAQKLKVEQGAYLAALLQAPSQYDWAVASKTGKRLVTERWNYVLDNMVKQHWLDPAKRQTMKFPIPKEPKGAPGEEGQKGYLVELANQQLEDQLMAREGISRTDAAQQVIKRGWTITLNVDKKKQAALEKAVKAELTSKLEPKKRKVDGNVQAGAVSVDPRTGKIVALYGGQDYLKHFYSNATRRDYQPASTFKPVILAAALEQNAATQSGKPINADTVYDGTSGRQVLDHGAKAGFGPPNEDHVDYGPITVQEAMNKSVNSVFAQMGVDVGMRTVMDTAKKLGMDTEGMQPVPAQTLGSMGASPLEMAGIYATFANHGNKVTPSILKSAEQKGRSIDIPKAIGGPVISRTAADSVTSVLTGVVDDGTAKKSVAGNPLRNGQQVAGKTGTSDKNKSAWFTGYTPDLVTSVGLFGEDKNTKAHVPMTGATGLLPPPGRVNGGTYPAKIWAAYTFGVTHKATFDLNTTQGAAVEPTDTPSFSQPPSTTPSNTPSSAPPSSSSPSATPSKTPVSPTPPSPTAPSPTAPTGTPTTGTPTDGSTDDPLDPGGNFGQ
ncbi:penicillin-binding protein [Streptomyces cellostaticus]|uniref:Penicillin-binding protein n=1 Tax=Streptomyces cellostaticus TaxID=67285 RepID=A0A101NJ40_9ACTN|nr:transglycosylase domain-containing protein [Streptomyces cellostaticus]KUM94125.1 penicillin-binding protein [Streptomyces cellostaticus]GHI05261.1 penicillin-binding protein [Streptomyces cellostaticus]